GPSEEPPGAKDAKNQPRTWGSTCQSGLPFGPRLRTRAGRVRKRASMVWKPPGRVWKAPARYGRLPAGYGRTPAGDGGAPEGYGRAPAGYGRPPAGYGRPPAETLLTGKNDRAWMRASAVRRGAASAK